MRRLALPRVRLPRRYLIGALAVLALPALGWFLVRDSPIVAVEEVVVTGASGPQAAQIARSLEDAGREMTTMNVDVEVLRDAVARYPVVAGVEADGKLLHRLDVTVRMREPIAALAHGDSRMAVAEDGTLLANTVTKDLPLVPVASPATGGSVADRDARAMVALLGAAPDELRPRIGRVEMADGGIIAHLTDGPELRFGPADQLREKWLSATRVLADPFARGATYLDIRVPERPAAGGLEAADTTTTPASQTQPEVETVQ